MPKKNQNRIADQELPEIREGVVVCRVGVTRGGSQFEVNDGENTWLVELPKKFRNTIWIRRGSFVLVNVGSGSTSISETRGEIIFVLQKEHISQLRKQGSWPSQLDETQSTPGISDVNQEQPADEGANHQSEEDDDNDTGSDSDLFQNNNRR